MRPQRAPRRGERRVGWSCAGTLLAGIAFATPAAANPFDMVGYDTDTGSIANAAIGWGRSIGVLNSNPALLVDVDPQLTLGLLLLAPQLHVRLQPRPAGSDVPMSIYDSNLGTTQGLDERSLPSVELASRRSDTHATSPETRLGVGFATDFGIDRLRVGVLAQLPITGGHAASIQTHYEDEREANFSNRLHFTRLGEWERIATVLLGGGFRVTDQLSVGGALQLAASATARLGVYIPDAAVQDQSSSNMDSQFETRWRPIAGIRWAPAKWASIGASWRNESYFQVDGVSDVTLWNYHEPSSTHTTLKRSAQGFPVVFDYEPMEASLGGGVKNGPVSFQVSANWERWSRYLDHHGQTADQAAILPSSPFPHTSIDGSKYAFHDTVSLRGGAIYRWAKDLETSLGGAYYPSPVPAQVGRTSYVDSAIVGITGGQRIGFDLFGHRIVASLGAQFWRMVTRTTHKDPSQVYDEMPDQVRTIQNGQTLREASGLQTNNPGFPGYEASGWVFAASTSLAYGF